MELIKEFIIDFSSGIFSVILKMAIIITIILVILEILRSLGVIDFLNKWLYTLTRFLGISKGSSLPLFIGIFIGITYGAASIIESYQQKEMSKKDVVLVSTFLCLCHAIIEDTLLFVALGANLWVIIAARIGLAIIITIIVRFIYDKIEKKNINRNINRDKIKLLKDSDLG